MATSDDDILSSKIVVAGKHFVDWFNNDFLPKSSGTHPTLVLGKGKKAPPKYPGAVNKANFNSVIDRCEGLWRARLTQSESLAFVTERVDIDGRVGEILSLFNDAFCRVLAPFYDSELEWYERPQILRYGPGGLYKRHADADHWVKESGQGVRSQDRDISVLMYLNEDYQGGSLFFPNQDFRVRSRAGMLAAFPSDHRYLHEAEPVTSGVRYVMVSWAAMCGSPRVRDKPPYASIVLCQKGAKQRA